MPVLGCEIKRLALKQGLLRTPTPLSRARKYATQGQNLLAFHVVKSSLRQAQLTLLHFLHQINTAPSEISNNKEGRVQTVVTTAGRVGP